MCSLGRSPENFRPIGSLEKLTIQDFSVINRVEPESKFRPGIRTRTELTNIFRNPNIWKTRNPAKNLENKFIPQRFKHMILLSKVYTVDGFISILKSVPT